MAAAPTQRAHDRHYTRIFARDAGISALGMAVSGDAALIAGAQNSLRTLAAHQAENGQIPNYVYPEMASADFWYLGCIDATLWWLIALHYLARLGHGIDAEMRAPMAKAITWLQCQEHPQLHLVQQSEASDWADIMPRSGFVLYTNALWYHVKCLYALPRREETALHVNHLFHPFTDYPPEYRRLKLLRDYVRAKAHNRGLYLSFVNLSFWGDEGDVLGNLLAVLFGLCDAQCATRVLGALDAAAIGDPYPVRAVCSPIGRSDHLWRAYMERHEQNLEYQYHNGGSWPFIGGFWVAALAAQGLRGRAEEALHRLALANQINDWEFNEWLHGRTGQPMGMPGQSWNAGMFLLAAYSLEHNVFAADVTAVSAAD